MAVCAQDASNNAVVTCLHGYWTKHLVLGTKLEVKCRNAQGKAKHHHLQPIHERFWFAAIRCDSLTWFSSPRDFYRNCWDLQSDKKSLCSCFRPFDCNLIDNLHTSVARLCAAIVENEKCCCVSGWGVCSLVFLSRKKMEQSFSRQKQTQTGCVWTGKLLCPKASVTDVMKSK